MVDGFVGHGSGRLVNLYHGTCDGIHSICQVLHIQAGTSAAITVIISAVTVAVSAI